MSVTIDNDKKVFYVGVNPPGSDYNDMENKPSINGHELDGDSSLSDLGLDKVFLYKDQVPTYNDLPNNLTESEAGWVYDVADTGENYAWNGESWDCLTGTEIVKDVQINETSVVSNGIAVIPVMNGSVYGVAKVGGGLQIGSGGDLKTYKATEVIIDAKSNAYMPIVPANLDYAVRSVRASYTTITASDTSYTLTSNATYGHIPTAATTYTLPTVVADVDNWTKLFVDCSNTASLAFKTSDNTAITPIGNVTITQGNKYIFVCQYNNLKSTWEVYIVDGGNA